MRFDAPGYTLHQGDCLQVLAGLSDASVDALITDPPYSSGGLMRSDRSGDPAAKYGIYRDFPTFSGDNRDQRSWLAWCTLWLSECRRILKPSAYVLLFTDWRMLPTTTDALQAAGLIWRGVVPWDKTEGSRAPHKGYFRHQCEYVVWGTLGAIVKPSPDTPWGEGTHPGPFPGCYRHAVRVADKHHVTGKPTDLMRQLVQCVEPGGLILDPFAGSGTTGVAALLEGRRFLGIECEASYAEISRERLAQVLAGEGVGQAAAATF